MNRGSRRLLLKSVKWVFIPLGLIVAGYFLVGPFVSDYVNQSKLDAKVQSKGK